MKREVGAAECPRHGSKKGHLWSLGFPEEAENDTFRPVEPPGAENRTHNCIPGKSGVYYRSGQQNGNPGICLRSALEFPDAEEQSADDEGCCSARLSVK